MVSTENVDMVVKAPKKPAPSISAVASSTTFVNAAAVIAPSNKEPTRFTLSVAQGNHWKESFR